MIETGRLKNTDIYFSGGSEVGDEGSSGLGFWWGGGERESCLLLLLIRPPSLWDEHHLYELL